jgi:hypothetical protein
MADFHRVPFVILAAVVLVLAGSLVHFWRSYREPLPPEYGWGDADTLAVNITLERAGISADDPMNYTATFKNTGTEKVRIFPWNWTISILIQISNESTTFPIEAAAVSAGGYSTEARPSDREFNRMLVVLAPNGIYAMKGSARDDVVWNHGWPLRAGVNGSVYMTFNSAHVRSFPALPVWSGFLRSDRVGFAVLP